MCYSIRQYKPGNIIPLVLKEQTMVDASKKTKLMVGAAAALIICGALYATRPTTAEVIAADRAEYQLEELVETAPVSLIDLTDNITPIEKVNVEPAFDPTGGHSPDTNLAIVRFCNAEQVETAWSIDVDTARRYYSPDLDTEVLVMTYTTGDWLILSQGTDDYCYPMSARKVTGGLKSIDDLIAPKL